jgi:hypothetical protein
VGQLRYDLNDLADSNDLGFGARLNVGSKNINGFLELGGTNSFGLPEGADAFSARMALGMEFRVAENLWISTGATQSFATESRPDPIAIAANLRWAIADKASFDPTK